MTSLHKRTGLPAVVAGNLAVVLGTGIEPVRPLLVTGF